MRAFFVSKYAETGEGLATLEYMGVLMPEIIFPLTQILIFLGPQANILVMAY